jgi:uncharacterized protein with GYD domain
MPIFVMLTRVSPESLSAPESYVALEQQATRKIRDACPGVEWLHNLAVLGPYDYLDIFRAPDNETAMKVAAIVRSSGHAHAEVWAAEEWRRFKDLVVEKAA